MSEHVYLEKHDIGATLTTWVYCAMWQMYAAEKVGKTAYINWPQDPVRALAPYYDNAAFARKPNMYDWYFEQPHHASPPHRGEVWTWEFNPPPVGQHCLMGQSIADIKAFYRSHLKFNVDVRARGEALVNKYGIDFSKTIGVTWRGTDCVTDGRPRMPIETYFPFIDDILRDKPDMRIACTAEEEGILGPLLARYPQAFVVTEFVSSPHGHPQNPEKINSRTGFERGMQPAIMVWLYSQFAAYVKNRSSLAAVASWMSTGHIVSLAHPENLGYGFDLTKAEINGELVPLVR